MKKYSVPLSILVTVLLFGGLVYLGMSAPNTPAEQSALSNREVALICTTDMATEFHIHPNLKIVVNGQEQPIPANIGVKPGCMNPLHTHTPDGVLHVESPIKRDFTLGDFFAVWNRAFTKEQILEYKVDGSKKIGVTVNGQSVTTFDDTVINDKDEIVITYGDV